MPSSVIRAFHYDPPSRDLLIIFQSGRRYTYQDVPEATFRSLKSASSKGEYFNTHIRNCYSFVRSPATASR
jgi:lysyl-tRNA synthetase class 2